MSRTNHIQLMASYNAWMNAKLYEAAAKLPAQALTADRKAFFGSLLGTLNHIVVGDTIWLQRFTMHPANYAALDPIRALPAPTSLSQILFADLPPLAAHRKMLDEVISRWVASIREEELDHALRYANTKGTLFQRRFHSLLTHFFNHQTHHRGQASTLLFQAGVDVGVTDLLAVIPDERESG